MITQLQKRYENEKPVGIKYHGPCLGIMVFDTLGQESKYDFVACFTDGVNKWGLQSTKSILIVKIHFILLKAVIGGI